MDRLTTQCDQDCEEGGRVLCQQLSRLGRTPAQPYDGRGTWRPREALLLPGYTVSQGESLDFNPNLSAFKLHVLHLVSFFQI